MILMATAGICLAGEIDKEPLFSAKQLELKAYGTARIADINGETDFGIGWGTDYFITKNLGIGLYVEQDNTSEEWVDRNVGRLTFRAPLWDRVSPYGYAQGIRDWEEHDWGAGAGAGLELRLSKHFSVFGEGGPNIMIDGDDNIQFNAGLKLSF